MYWEALLEETLKEKSPSPILNNYSSIPPEQAIGDYTPGHKNDSKKFFLGAPHEHIYFTGREAQVMVQLMHGKTISAVAAVLELSPRTIEFYVKNMKTKLACRTKSELIGKVFASDFVRNINFMASILGESA